MKKAILLSCLFICSAIFIHAQTLENITIEDSLKKAGIREMKCLMPVFKSKKPREDSAFAANYSLDHEYHVLYYREGTYPEFVHDDFEKAKKGDVVGPYVGDGWVSIYKIIDKIKSVDSVQVRHILVAYSGADRADPKIIRTKKQAKERADSICNLITSRQKKMEDLVTKELTDDPGSWNGNKGNYGWFDRPSGFVKEFKDFGFDNPVGKASVVETAFGYHIIQVVAKSQEWPFTVVVILARPYNWDLMYESSGGIHSAGLSRWTKCNASIFTRKSTLPGK